MHNNKIILKNASIVDVNHEKACSPCNVVIENDVITTITHEKCDDKNVQIIDLSNHTLLPGLIDCHVHVSATQFDLTDTTIPESYRAIQAKKYLEDMLQ